MYHLALGRIIRNVGDVGTLIRLIRGFVAHDPFNKRRRIIRVVRRRSSGPPINVTTFSRSLAMLTERHISKFRRILAVHFSLRLLTISNKVGKLKFLLGSGLPHQIYHSHFAIF